MAAFAFSLFALVNWDVAVGRTWWSSVSSDSLTAHDTVAQDMPWPLSSAPSCAVHGAQSGTIFSAVLTHSARVSSSALGEAESDPEHHCSMTGNNSGTLFHIKGLTGPYGHL